MTNCGELRLRDDVLITPLTLEHVPTTYHFVSDPIVQENLGLRSEPSLEKTSTWIERASLDPSTCAFAIVLGPQHVGNIVLDRIDTYLRSARLSIYLGDVGARGVGVALSGAHLALAHAFEELALHKVWLTVHVGNSAAISLYARLGFVVEGVLRDEFWLDGHRTSVLYMGLMRSEFGPLTTK